MTNFSGRFAEEMARWFQQPDPKPGKQTFYARLCCKYPKEQAILMWKKWEKVVESRGVVNRVKKYIPTYSLLQDNEDMKEFDCINITYPIEIAGFFRKAFMNMIDKLEWEIRETDDKDWLKDLYDKLEFTKEQYDLFNFYNPIKWESQKQTY